jgi:c-di-GMP-binding flagellar brake protein YcgR
VVDLSGGGICFSLDREIPNTAKIGLELLGIPEAGTIDVMCHVVRVAPVERSDGSVIYHVGAAFQHLPRATSNKIVRYLFAVQRANIAKGIKE